MSAEIKKEIELEIAHVLFTDIVGYSKLPIHQQRALVERLNEIVRDRHAPRVDQVWINVLRNARDVRLEVCPRIGIRARSRGRQNC
jgi:hypothetical protein